MICKQCKRPSGGLLTSQTIRLTYTAQQLQVANLWLSPDEYGSNQYLEFKYKDNDPNLPYLSFKDGVLPIYTPGEAIAISDHKAISVKVSSDADNALTIGVDDGLYVKSVPTPDLSNYYTKTEIDSKFSNYYTSSMIDSKLLGLQNQISTNATSISQEVSRATAQESELISAIVTTDTNLSNEVSRATNKESELDAKIAQIKTPTFEGKDITSIEVDDGISGVIDGSGKLTLSLTPLTGKYFTRFELSQLAGFNALQTNTSIQWGFAATVAPVVALPVPLSGIGTKLGFETEFINIRPDGDGSINYKVKLSFSVITDATTDGTTTITIGDPSSWGTEDGAFHIWVAGIEPAIDYTNQHTEPTDIYTFSVNNFGITRVNITLNMPVAIENRLRRFYFGISMKGWFPSPQGLSYKLFDYMDLELIPSV